MSKSRDELDQLLWTLAQQTLYATEANDDPELRVRADVLRAALDPAFCKVVRATARKYLDELDRGIGLGSSLEREGNEIARRIELVIGSKTWLLARKEALRVYKTSTRAGKEALEEPARALAQAVVGALTVCPITRAKLRRVPGYAPAPENPELREAAIRRIVPKLVDLLSDGELEARAFGIEALVELGCSRANAHKAFEKTAFIQDAEKLRPKS